MKQTDTLQHFIFEHASIRGEIVHLHDAYQTIMQQRLYPPVVKKLLGEALVSCRCNQDKMKQVLTILGEADVQQLLQETGQVEVSCEFCNQRYVFDPIDITMLFRK